MGSACIRISGVSRSKLTWAGQPEQVGYGKPTAQDCLVNLSKSVYIVGSTDKPGLVSGEGEGKSTVLPLLGWSPALTPEALGDAEFKKTYHTRFAYMTGAMANGIASAELVIAVGKAGMLGSFGSAGMVPSRLEAAIQKVQEALPDGPYAFNLIHSPSEEAMEHKAVELFLRNGVRVIEASAFLDLTTAVVWYRACGLQQNPDGSIQIKNRIIVKLSRKEVAVKFMAPAPESLLVKLVSEGRITELQAQLARQVPVADDITVEADSGGHTDNRPLVVLLPGIMALRDEMQAKYNYPTTLRVGAAGGISTPSAALAAFMMGAAYVVTGSINQACVEAGASPHTRKLLSQAGMADVAMAPSADMFEMGVRVQVLKNGTFFPMRATKLYELYTKYNSIEEIPPAEREKIEKQIFRKDLESIWQETVRFFQERDPEQIERAAANPKRRMALVFRWYLGLASRWSNTGEPGREMDYQIWCGPSIGSFNEWTHGTYLADPQNRKTADVALHILKGAAYQWRIQHLRMQGVQFSPDLENYRPLNSNS